MAKPPRIPGDYFDPTNKNYRIVSKTDETEHRVEVRTVIKYLYKKIEKWEHIETYHTLEQAEACIESLKESVKTKVKPEFITRYY